MSKADQRRPGAALNSDQSKIRQRRGARPLRLRRYAANPATKTKTPLAENGIFKPTAIGIQGLSAVRSTLNHRLNFWESSNAAKRNIFVTRRCANYWALKSPSIGMSAHPKKGSKRAATFAAENSSAALHSIDGDQEIWPLQNFDQFIKDNPLVVAGTRLQIFFENALRVTDCL
jgi:hypothetical protein